MFEVMEKYVLNFKLDFLTRSPHTNENSFNKIINEYS